jgi:hypothetical protein
VLNLKLTDQSSSPLPLLLLTVTLWSTAPRLLYAQPYLDAAYHNPDEIHQELIRLHEDFTDEFVFDSIGHGSFYEQPIWLAKISDNVAQRESEPALLFIGQVHAEEVMGVEITLRVMRDLLENRDDTTRARVEGLELYFIPTLNPDGLQVVHEGIDLTFRKNCRDNIGDGEFRYVRGMGHDTSGVDLNRNFSLHWDRGDSLLLDNGEADTYNYYRGAAPFSEPETQCLRDLMLGHRFQFSLSFHSSRSGQNSELVIAPWNWSGKRPPDDPAINALSTAIAGTLRRQYIEGTYNPVRATQRVGQEQDWAYQATGCFMYMVEIGADVQPDSAIMTDLVVGSLDAVYFLMDLAIGEASIDNYGILSTLTYDSLSSTPVSARVSTGAPAPLLSPRTGDPLTGRFDQLIQAGSYDVTFEQEGYYPVTIEDVGVQSGRITSVEGFMRRIPSHQLEFVTYDDSTNRDVAATISFIGSEDRPRYSLNIDGRESLELSRGFHRLLIRAPDYVPLLRTIQVRADSTYSFALSRVVTTYTEEFESDAGWQRGGQCEDWGVGTVAGRSCLLDSPEGPYGSNCFSWLHYNTNVRPEAVKATTLELIHLPYFEPGYDSGRLEAYRASTNSWIPLMSFSCFRPEEWDTTYVSLDGLGLEGSNLRFQFLILSDGSVSEDGWLIDRLRVLDAGPPTSISEGTVPSHTGLISVYPSPSNSFVNIAISHPFIRTGSLVIFDRHGREIHRRNQLTFESGVTAYPIDLTGQPSGNYFVTFNSANTPSHGLITSFVLLK